jgi:fructose-1,6-bisphosphatase I
MGNLQHGVSYCRHEGLDNYVAFDDSESKSQNMSDPLDGSASFMCNVSIGTIFGVYRRVSARKHSSKEDFYKKVRNRWRPVYCIWFLNNAGLWHGEE